MTNNLQQQLRGEFPGLFSNGLVRDIDCGDGWFYLVHGLCRELQDWGEKYSEVSLYHIGADEDGLVVRADADQSSEIKDMLIMYKRMTKDVCSECGHEHDNCSCITHN